MKKFFKFLFITLLVLILLAVAGVAVALMLAPAENRAEVLKEMSDFVNSKMPVKAETGWLAAEEPDEASADVPLPDGAGTADPYADFTPAVIADQDGVTVTATGFKKIVSRLGETTYELYFSVKNSTAKEIYMGSEDTYLDHCGCFCFCLAADGETYFDVPAGETKDGLLRITPKLDKYGLDADPQTADALLYYRTRPEDYGRGAGTVHHHLNCAAIPLVPQAADVSPEPFGTKLFSCRGVDFYLLGAEPDDSSLLGNGTELDMLVVNNSGDDFWIDDGDATKVNGEPGKVIDSGYFSESVPAGGFCLGSFRVHGESSGLETLEFRLALRDLYSGEVVGRTRTALVTVK